MPRVTLAYAWTDPDGKEHKPDSSPDLDQATADNLVIQGWARPTDEGKKGSGNG